MVVVINTQWIILIKVLTAILKVCDNKYIRLFKDTVYDQGIKIAIKKVVKVLKKHFFVNGRME